MKTFTIKTDNPDVRKSFLKMLIEQQDDKPNSMILKEVGEIKKTGKDYSFKVTIE